MKVLFMGTPDFAVATLEAIIQSGFEVCGVVTAPDRPSGRGLQLKPSPVKECGLRHKLLILQPEKLKDESFLHSLKEINPDIAVVVAFRMLPEVVWSLPPKGTLNLHASLLPDYRGAAPINRAIMNGETVSGVTTFFIEKEIDTGDILLQEKIAIGSDMNAGELHDVMMEAGANLVVKTLKMIEAGNLHSKPQDSALARHSAPKIFREDCRIDWNRNPMEVHDFIRGLSPYPASWTELEGKTLKIYSGTPVFLSDGDLQPGIVISDGRDQLAFACKGGYYLCESIQIEGKKRMQVGEFLRGHRLTNFVAFP